VYIVLMHSEEVS